MQILVNAIPNLPLDFLPYEVASKETLVSGAKFYRTEGIFIWILFVGLCGQNLVYRLKKDLNHNAYYHHRVSEEEAEKIFPVLL